MYDARRECECDLLRNPRQDEVDGIDVAYGVEDKYTGLKRAPKN